MAKPKKIVGKGMGWHRETVRHSRARRTGRAGGTYLTAITKEDLHTMKQNKRDYDKFKKELIKKNPSLTNKKIDKLLMKNPSKLWKLDSDKDGTADIKDCQPLNPKKQDSYKTFPIKKGYEIIAHFEKTRNGFRHIAILIKDGQEIDRAKATYLNRTWERYEYESVIKKLLDKTTELTQAEKNKFLGKTEQKDKEELEAKFGTISMIAKLGEVFAKTQKERVDWKKRMLKAGIPQLDIPEDWETLSDKEKESRLDKVIEFMQKKPA